MHSHRSTLAALTLASVAAAASLVFVHPALGAGTPLPSNAVLVAEGHGWGHGRGMGQWGAKGQADAGKTWSQIVLSYYSGVTIGTRPADEDLRVLVETSSDVLVSSAAPFTVKWIGQGTLAASDATFKFFRARHDGTVYIVEKSASSTGPWTVVGTNTVPARFMPGTELMQHVEESGVVRYYRGFVDGIKTGTTSMRTINELTMTQYLYGAVPREMPATWAPEAVRAQSVAARSYATYKRDGARAAGQNYDICATTSCQVYLGAASRPSVASTTVTQLEHAASSAAVDATAGKVLFSAGKPILAEYSSSTGGYSAAGSVSYLSAVPDQYDSVSPHHDWTTDITATSIEDNWPEIGELVGVNVTERNGFGEWGGRVLKMQLIGTIKTLTISGETFRSAFSWPSSGGVKSTWFRIATFQGVLSSTPGKLPVVAGAYGVLPILMKNTGTAAWPLGGAVRLATPAPSTFAGSGWISSTRPAAVTSNASVPGKTSIGPNEVARFDVRLNTGLLAPGSYTQELRLVNDDLGTSISSPFTIAVPVVLSIVGVVRGNTWYLHTGAADTTLGFGKTTDRPIVGDWDGDGTDTPGLVRGNVWYLNNGTDNIADVSFAFGKTTDLPIVGDWNGDGTDSPGVVRGNLWYLNNGFDSTAEISFGFGQPTDAPLAGDWNGNGTDTPGLVRGNIWYLNNAFDSVAETSFAYGQATDRPIAGDWDGDGTDTAGLVRGNVWYLNNGTDAIADVSFAYGQPTDVPIVGEWSGPPKTTPALVEGNVWGINMGFDPDADAEVAYGAPDDRPVAGDWDGDGGETPGVFRGNVWYLNNGFGPFADVSFAYGQPTDAPLVGDWDGDGTDSVGVFRDNVWYLNNGTDNIADVSFAFGQATDIPVTGDWDGDGTDTPGVVRGNVWYLSNSFDGLADVTLTFGSAGGTPLAGDWDGDGTDTPGLVQGSTWKLSNGFDGDVDITFSFGSGSGRPVVGRWIG
ncbi:MAG: SpoIID/LytB domain-containing protein [Actinomycetota bacterium]